MAYEVLGEQGFFSVKIHVFLSYLPLKTSHFTYWFIFNKCCNIGWCIGILMFRKDLRPSTVYIHIRLFIIHGLYIVGSKRMNRNRRIRMRESKEDTITSQI